MRILSLFVWINGCFALFVPRSLVAQVVPDQTLGSIVTSSDQSRVTITGGTIVDRNLFHSFDRFSLNAGQTAIFSPDSAIANIIARVTGTDASRIDGTIAVNGNANLFLINPKGIFFGQNASLAINGSFLATTAPGIRFADGTSFPVDRTNPPLLTISTPIDEIQPIAPITNAGNLSVGRDLSIIGSDVSGSGQFSAGNQVAIKANSLTLDRARISAGIGGTDLDVQNAIVLKDSQIASTIDSTGIGGNITLHSGSLQMFGGSNITTTLNGTGTSGSIGIQANSIELAGTNGLSPEIASNVTRNGVGTAGNIRVTARTIALTNRAKITALTLGQAATGNVEITAHDRITIHGTNEIFTWLGLISRLFSDPTIRIENTVFKNRNRTLFPVETVIGASKSQTGVIVSSFTPFQAGNLSIAAPDIRFENQALLAMNNWGSGDGGGLKLVAEQFAMQDSSLFVSTISGRGANIEISTPRLKLDQGAIVSGTAQGQGGNITLNVPELLLLRNRSRIAARGFNNVDSGNIDINAGFIVAKPIENSVIIANAITGRGGNIRVNARSLIGIKYDQILASSSSPSIINAGSQFGLSGEVTLKVLQSDPGSEVVKLPTEMTDTSTQIDRTCSARSRINSFTRTGRGGIAPDLVEMNRSTLVWTDSSTQNTVRSIEDAQIVEATGWIRNLAGQIVLVADGSNAPIASSVTCEW